MCRTAMRIKIGGAILSACLSAIPMVGHAQIGTPALVDGTPSAQNPFGVKTPSVNTPKTAQAGTLFSETLRGGGNFGYMLSHGGIVPGSLRVSIGARSLKE